jgi:hypothetical protein
MKRFMILAAAALISSSAVAQTIQVAPEQRTVIHKYVTEKRIAPARLNERVVVGATIPQDVELVTVPSEWGPTFTKYRYVYADNHVYFVEPSSRKVVTVVD